MLDMEMVDCAVVQLGPHQLHHELYTTALLDSSMALDLDR